MSPAFWQWFEARADRIEARRLLMAERAEARQLLLIDRGLDARSNVRRLIESADPRLFIALAIIAGFFVAYLRETDRDTRNLMVGAIIAAFAGAWGYYLGNSNNAAKAGERSDQATQLANEAIKRLPAPPAQLPNGTQTIDELSVEEKAEIERLIVDEDATALADMAKDIPDAAGKTDPRELATLIVKARRAG
jgi:hypothetical protein